MKKEQKCFGVCFVLRFGKMLNSIVIGVEPLSLINFRGQLLKDLSNTGCSVTTLSNLPTAAQIEKLNDLGVDSKTVHFSRGKLSVYADIKVFFELVNIFRRVKPSLILAYTIKPVIWGGLASRFINVDFYALITGLGFAFQGTTFKRKMLTKLVVFLYKIALRNSKAVIFQNSDNRDLFVENQIVDVSKTFVVNGSGVDLKFYDYKELPKGNVIFLCIARLISEKGLREYAAAAKLVKSSFPNVELLLVGPEEPSEDAIHIDEVNSWAEYIDYRGSVSDVREYIEKSHVFVLPSYHEGIPRSTLEAMSMGRPVITTDAVGCKNTVDNNINGFKVPVGTIEELAEKMIWFIKNPDRIESMGLESRKIIRNKFDVDTVNSGMLKIMGLVDETSF
jgi:glycosyltransferase involved in cell wall biosynthesis